MAEQVEECFEQDGIAVKMGLTKAERVAGLEDHICVMTRQIAIASLMPIGVGALGLASALSVSVLERTKEVGILRSLGATPFKLAKTFASEGAAIGVVSLAIGMAVSFPLGRTISNYFAATTVHNRRTAA